MQFQDQFKNQKIIAVHDSKEKHWTPDCKILSCKRRKSSITLKDAKIREPKEEEGLPGCTLLSFGAEPAVLDWRKGCQTQLLSFFLIPVGTPDFPFSQWNPSPRLFIVAVSVCLTRPGTGRWCAACSATVLARSFPFLPLSGCSQPLQSSCCSKDNSWVVDRVWNQCFISFLCELISDVTNRSLTFSFYPSVSHEVEMCALSASPQALHLHLLTDDTVMQPVFITECLVQAAIPTLSLATFRGFDHDSLLWSHRSRDLLPAHQTLSLVGKAFQFRIAACDVSTCPHPLRPPDAGLVGAKKKELPSWTRIREGGSVITPLQSPLCSLML